MPAFTERVSFAKDAVAQALLKEDRTVTFDTLTAELLVEAVTELMLVNEEIKADADKRLMARIEKNRERLAKKNQYCEKLARKNDVLVRENRILRKKVADNERKLMQGTGS